MGSVLFCALVLFLSFVHSHGVEFSRHSFPPDFTFGAGSSSYQYEGAANIRGKNIWDTFTKQHPEKIKDHSTGDVAIDFYHRYKDDIEKVKFIKMDAFRFSIAWSRVLPTGRVSGGVSQTGLKFYNDLINDLKANGTEPYVTLFHWDLPQALENEYDGFLNRSIVDDFRDYANFSYQQFGDRVKHWTTFNEPYVFAINGYSRGSFAPGRCSNYTGNCTEGNAATEPYIVSHHQLLAHGAAVKLYKEKYQESQKGIIGITLNSFWLEPKYNTTSSVNASHRALDFMLGWFVNPIVHGNYPEIMITNVGNRLPKFWKNESEMLKGSFDFIGINYYTSNYVTAYASPVNESELSWAVDARINLTTSKNGVDICEPTDMEWLFICPWGLKKLLIYIKDKYNNPTIIITENGMGTRDKLDTLLPLKEQLNDTIRIYYHRHHLHYLHEAMKDGVNVTGYFVWSSHDNFNWGDGFTARFGIILVDYNDGLKRYLKHSALWFKKFLQK